MSNKSNGFKLSAGPSFVSQSQEDGEELPPSCARKDRPDYLGPDPFTVTRKLNAD